MFLVLLVSVLTALVSAQIRPLGVYNVDRTRMSVSGLSSGACMASQFHVVHSSKVYGAAIFAGAPYFCARGSSITALSCMSTPSSINVQTLVTETNNRYASGDIDNPTNMNGKRVFVYNGQSDSVVNVGVGQKIVDYYNAFGVNVQSRFNLAAEHGQPTVNNGVTCNTLGTEYINRCNYDGAYTGLNHIYGSLTRPTGTVPLNGDFYEYDQNEFFYVSPPSASSMHTSGFVYVPTACVSGTTRCRLHVAFHGCRQGATDIGTAYAEYAGYNEVGELNNIIILYPQAIANVWLGNMMGCWDWWGYTHAGYATKTGNQILAVDRMMTKISGASE